MTNFQFYSRLAVDPRRDRRGEHREDFQFYSRLAWDSAAGLKTAHYAFNSIVD